MVQKVTRLDVLEILAQFREDNIKLEERRVELVKKYPGKWAGMCDGVLKFGDTQEEVVSFFGNTKGKKVALRFLGPVLKLIVSASQSKQ